MSLKKFMFKKNKRFQDILIIGPIVLALLIFTVLTISLYHTSDDLPSPLIGKPLPQFEMAGLDGTPRALTSEHFKGKVTLINIWASWCVSCKAEHPQLSALKEQADIALYGINIRDNNKNALNFLALNGNPYDRIGVDKSRKVSIDLGVYNVPETLIVDKNGIMAYKHIGPISELDVEQIFLPKIQVLNQEQSP